MKREEGYYWVFEFGVGWTIAELQKIESGHNWWATVGGSGWRFDEDFEQIGPRILPPVSESQHSDVSKEQLPLFENH